MLQWYGYKLQEHLFTKRCYKTVLQLQNIDKHHKITYSSNNPYDKGTQ